MSLLRNKRKLIVIASVAVAACAIFGYALVNSNRASIRIIVYNRGTTTQLKPGSSKLEELVAACEEALTSSDSGRMLQLAVFPKTIEDVKKNSVSIEVIYPNLQTFKVGASGRILEIDRLLVQLSQLPSAAPAENKAVTVFYGKSEAYSSGPYTNSGQFDVRIRNLLRDLGLKTD